MGWLYLILGILAELIGTTSMKLSEGFTKLTPSISIFIFYGLSLTLVTLSLKTIDISIAYAIWSGVGTASIAVIGILFFREDLSLLKILSISFIIIGVVGLNLGENTQENTINISTSQKK
ncbi:multidrug efflux SMR transporter [Neobacillus thermocopriae]|uniref:DMT family transporter n=1 Tax=Neobacillus thermocopriae TaxID=1215031 RepID=UPI002E2511C8|nr:multidrug efflux SMR transporter [Neobacillus thermocopriae]MED3714835.1 multidrug efflux SMR transporter [Neobacillus thermocopriae]